LTSQYEAINALLPNLPNHQKSKKLESICWNWFEQSGQPSAYIEYKKANQAKNHDNF